MIKLSYDEDKKYNILSVRWEDEITEFSEEIDTKEGNHFVIDYSKNGKIIGIEIFDYEIKEGRG